MNTYKYFACKAASLVIVVAILLNFGTWASQASAHDEQVQAQILEAERASSRGPYPTDGTFTGQAQGFGGPVIMQALIDNGYIDRVEILDAHLEDGPWLEMCLDLPDLIVKRQTTDIDVVSGATYTSSGILNGTTEALRQSLEGGA